MINNKSERDVHDSLRRRIPAVEASDFESLALDIFRYQSQHNPLYKEFINHLRIRPEDVNSLTGIPFLPISFFKTHTIQTGNPARAKVTFESSGTTGMIPSRHPLYDPELYEQVSVGTFESMYGKLKDFHILALLPSYLERASSSLVYMMRHFVERSHSTDSGFYLHNIEEMLERLRKLSNQPDDKPVLLLGVTFALLDLAESDHDLSFLKKMKRLMVMDTGGMKGRRQELIREEVHDILKAGFHTEAIHSEYGMTELLSQSYAQGEGLFRPGATMRIVLRDTNDPFAKTIYQQGISRTGGVNVVDLANLDSCSFIETQDLGRFGPEDQSFYIMGRFDNSDVRGCNLMVI